MGFIDLYTVTHMESFKTNHVPYWKMSLHIFRQNNVKCICLVKVA